MKAILQHVSLRFLGRVVGPNSSFAQSLVNSFSLNSLEAWLYQPGYG